LVLKVDGISRTTPFVHDTLVGFSHTVEAANQSAGSTSYNFVSWSDGAPQLRTIIVPSTATSYVASFAAVQNPLVSAVGAAQASGTGTSLSVTHGLAIQANDVVVAFVHVNGNQRVTPNAGTGFTELVDAAGPDTNGHAIYSKVAGAAEPASYQWTMPTNERWSVEIRVFRNVNTASIWNVAPSASSRSSSTNGGTATAPSASITTPGAMGIVWVLSDTATQTFSNPTNSYGSALVAPGQPQATYLRSFTTAGATGATSVTQSTNDWMAYQIALRPAP
jgi:hypothetical protein